MPWFVAKRPLEPSQPEPARWVCGVVSEADELFWDDPD
jgi:hypothetical protein